MGDLEVFVAVVEAGGFTAAAEALGTTVTATSRRVRALEERLGTRLLNRTTRRVSLTAAGEVYYQQVRRVLAELRETEEQLTQQASDPHGPLRLTAPMSFGVRRLTALVARFARAHPRLQVQLQLDDRLVDIVAEGLDLALRIGYPQDSSLVARPLAPVARYICASPEYLRARGAPETPLDLLRHDCLHYSNLSEREEWTLQGPGGPEPVAVKGRFCSNNGDALCQAALEGLGIALLPDFIVEQALGEGRLVRVLERHQPAPFTLYALYPSRQFVPAKIRLFLEFLVGALGPARLPVERS
jgi:DNA-binding transcriptional LysR family regulator